MRCAAMLAHLFHPTFDALTASPNSPCRVRDLLFVSECRAALHSPKTHGSLPVFVISTRRELP